MTSLAELVERRTAKGDPNWKPFPRVGSAAFYPGLPDGKSDPGLVLGPAEDRCVENQWDAYFEDRAVGCVSFRDAAGVACGASFVS